MITIAPSSYFAEVPTVIQPDQPDRTLTSPPVGPPPPDETEWRNEATDRNTVPPPAGNDDTPDATRTSPANSTTARIGRYLIRRLLGKGGMGSVYLAHDPELDRPVALKVPQVSGVEAGERFLREARAAAAVSHPNLCPVYDAGRADDVHYLAMAYVPGPTLTQVLRESGPLPPARAVAVVAGIARGVAEAHRHGIVHRDLKPGNVLVNGKGEPVVTDFGLALRTGVPDLTVASPDAPADPRLTQAGAIMGTPAYMPPEQARGDVDKVGPAADVYALGAILHELLTGQPPFRADTVPALIRKIESEPPPAPSATRPDIPAGLDVVVRKALAKEPAGRYATADAFAAALAPFAAPPRRRWPVAVAAGVVTLLAVVAGVIFYVKTDNGTVEVRLNEATADVQVSVDGNQITVVDGERKTTLRPGEHGLEVKGPDYETETRVFRVKRGEKAVLEIELKPKEKGEPKPPPKADPPKSDPKAADRTRLAQLLTRGRQLADAARYAELAAVARDALAIDPESPGALALRATHHATVGMDRPAALADAEAALKLNPETFQALVIRGSLRGWDGKLDEAIADFTAAIRLRPDHPGAYALRSQGYLEKKEYRQVIADATRAIELGHKLPDPLVNRATAHAFLGEYAKATADYDAAIKLVPNPNSFIQRSAVHAKAGDLQKAEADWAEAKRLVPGLPDKARLVLPDAPKPPERTKLSADDQAAFDKAKAEAHDAWETGLLPVAWDEANKAMKLDPSDGAVRSLRARLLFSQNKLQAAWVEADEAIRLNPTDAYAYGVRASAKSEAKDYAGAVADGTIGVTLGPKLATMWNNRARDFSRLKMHHQSFADANEALRLRPGYGMAHANRGAFYMYTGDYTTALKEYRLAAEAEPKSARWRTVCASLCEKLKDAEGEEKERALAVAIDPRLKDSPLIAIPVPLPPPKMDPPDGEPK